MNLSLLLIVPLITALGILPAKGLKQVRACHGWCRRAVPALRILLFAYLQERASGNTAAFLLRMIIAGTRR